MYRGEEVSLYLGVHRGHEVSLYLGVDRSEEVSLYLGVYRGHEVSLYLGMDRGEEVSHGQVALRTAGATVQQSLLLLNRGGPNSKKSTVRSEKTSAGDRYFQTQLLYTYVHCTVRHAVIVSKGAQVIIIYKYKYSAPIQCGFD